ncbi:MAG: methyltransferase domain-containing protein [Myxococcota bacterium]
MSGAWKTASEQWKAWISEDGDLASGAANAPIDDLDARIADSLTSHPFPGGDEQTVSQPAPSDDEGQSFESRTTLVRSTVDLPEEPPKTLAPEALEIGLAAPEGQLEVSLEVPPIGAHPVTSEAPPPPAAEAEPEPAEASDGEDGDDEGDDGLFIPTLTRTLVSPTPTPASDELPPDELPPAISGETVIGPPPTAPAGFEEEPVPVAAGMIESEPDDAAETLVRGEIPDRASLVDEGAPDPVPPPASKVVIAPAASGVLDVAYDHEDDDPDEEPHELDADDLVEEGDEVIEEIEDASPPPAPPASGGLDVGRPPPPVSSASLHAAISTIAPAPPVDPSWQIDAFGEHYAALLPVNRAASAAIDADFVLQCMGLPAGSPILDVGCGDGAHAVAFAARGMAVTGLDPSPAQLMRASHAAQAAGAAVNLISGDMRQPSVEGSFSGVVCLGGTIGLFGDEDDRLAIQQMRDRLAPGGRLMIQVLNRDYIVGRLPARSWWQGQGCLVLDEAQIYAPTSTVHVHRTVVFETGSQFEHNMGLRVYGLTELVHMCAQVGLKVLEYSGSRHARGHFYGGTSSEIWLLAQRVDG